MSDFDLLVLSEKGYSLPEPAILRVKHEEGKAEVIKQSTKDLWRLINCELKMYVKGHMIHYDTRKRKKTPRLELKVHVGNVQYPAETLPAIMQSIHDLKLWRAELRNQDYLHIIPVDEPDESPSAKEAKTEEGEEEESEVSEDEQEEEIESEEGSDESFKG